MAFRGLSLGRFLRAGVESSSLCLAGEHHDDGLWSGTSSGSQSSFRGDRSKFVASAGRRSRTHASFGDAKEPDVEAAEEEKEEPDEDEHHGKEEMNARRKRHNTALDLGMKFNVSYASPLIRHTNLFDLSKFGCYDELRLKEGSSSGYLSAKKKLAERCLGGYCGKQWWVHPSIKFNAAVRRVGVNLQDLTSGELRWDAIYLADKREGEEEAFVRGDALPIGGNHPFFLPDWCPAPADFMAHKFRLRVKNLDAETRPGLESYGDVYFTLYGPSQLANSYQWENNDEGGYDMPEDTASCLDSKRHFHAGAHKCDLNHMRSCGSQADLQEEEKAEEVEEEAEHDHEQNKEDGMKKLLEIVSGGKALPTGLLEMKTADLSGAAALAATSVPLSFAYIRASARTRARRLQRSPCARGAVGPVSAVRAPRRRHDFL
eukprot:TRINITY_DN36967_c0_g1_i1.p1 TRINITY_DN36967_c0_g1~~TRINITY_DN36967_c0_g1_i1.p1  ORF type:complete len:460 (+),score=96.20 TRINITY_DN36967_c0_g1_i1:88-1380(+)